MTANVAKMNFFILIFSVEVPLRFPSVHQDGSRRRVSPQARGGGTGGREVRWEQVSSVSCTLGELPGEKIARFCPAGIITDSTAGAWQERGGQGQAVAQQAGSVSQQAEAQTSGAGTVTAEAMGATAKEASRARRAAAFIKLNVVHAVGVSMGRGSRGRSPSRGKGGLRRLPKGYLRPPRCPEKIAMWTLRSTLVAISGQRRNNQAAAASRGRSMGRV